MSLNLKLLLLLELAPILILGLNVNGMNDFFGLENYMSSIGTDPKAFFEGCKADGVEKKCLNSMMRDGSPLGSLTSNRFVKMFLDVDKMSEQFKMCNEPEGQKVRDMQGWVKVLVSGEFDLGSEMKAACKRQICKELRQCEDTVNNMCSMTELMNGSPVNLIGQLNKFGDWMKKNSARDTVDESCAKMAEIAAGQSSNPFGEMFGIGRRGTMNQMTGSMIGNPDGALKTGQGMFQAGNQANNLLGGSRGASSFLRPSANPLGSGVANPAASFLGSSGGAKPFDLSSLFGGRKR